MEDEEDEIKIRKQIDEYIKKCKPKYFNRDDISELFSILNTVNNYLDKSRNKTNKEYLYIKNENKLLKSKLEAIRGNIEKSINVDGILIHLDNLKNDENLIIRIFIKIYLYIFYIMFYFWTKYNNKRIIKNIKN